jgi:hypothetical protein
MAFQIDIDLDGGLAEFSILLILGERNLRISPGF